MSAVHYLLYLFGVVLFLLLGVIVYYKHCFSYWKKRGLEYLEPAIPFGNATKVFQGKSNWGEMYMNWYLELKKRGLKHGGAYLFGKPVYIPVDPAIIKRILISDFQYFPNHSFHVDPKNDPLSIHLLNMEDPRWRNVRSKLPVAFTSAKMRKMFSIMAITAQEMLKQVDQHASQGPVSIKRILVCFATDIITSAAFGMQSNTLKGENPLLLKHGRVFFDQQWDLWNYTITVVVPKRIRQLFKYRIFPESTTQYFFDMFKSIRDHKLKEGSNRSDMADLLLRLCNEDDELLQKDFAGKQKMSALNEQEFVAQMYILFEAGFETSSSTQTFALYELAANPDVQKRLREEINTVLDKHNGRLSYDAVMEMEYLDRIVDETLRKYPIFPIISRGCAEDYKVPGTDVVIEKGTYVMTTNLGLQRDPEYWPEPDKFDPERFTAENKAKRPFCSYLPFSEGPRICLGKRFGLLQSKVGLITLIKNFEISLSSKCKLPFKFVPSQMMLTMEGEVWLDMKRIQQES